MVIIKRPTDIKPSEITDESVYLGRRRFMQGAGVLAAGAMLPAMPATAAERKVLVHDGATPGVQEPPPWLARQIAVATPGPYSTDEKVTPYEWETHYNNFYEFGTDKGDPAKNATDFKSEPWSVEVGGEAEVTGRFTLEDILKPHPLQERIYRLRCVEAWSMVIPWIGFPLSDLIKRFKPTSNAKFVRFQTLLDPKQMPQQRSLFRAIDYPYVEGLRMDEAMNELAFVAVGLYGKHLPPQNGAPLRLVVPWKYGFKGAKSIVKIDFVRNQPMTTWHKQNTHEYGFYSNVNPHVDHPRWSQAHERRLPNSLFDPHVIPTKMFNGYAEQVAYLYKGMDLRKDF